MTRTVDIKGFIDDRPVSAYQWLVVALCFLVVVADGMDVAIMGFVTPPILGDWGVSRAAFGLRSESTRLNSSHSGESRMPSSA